MTARPPIDSRIKEIRNWIDSDDYAGDPGCGDCHDARDWLEKAMAIIADLRGNPSPDTSLIEKLEELKYKGSLNEAQEAENLAVDECIAIVRQHIKHDAVIPENGPNTSRLIDKTSEISNNYELTQRLEESLAYFCDEFPKDQCPDIWVKPISHHCGGITPNDLQALLSILYAARKPVTVSLEVCAEALYSKRRDRILHPRGEDWDTTNGATQRMYRDEAKAILDAAGIQHVD